MRIVESRPSPHFSPISLASVYNKNIVSLTEVDCSTRVLAGREHLLCGENVLWGIPFRCGEEGGRPNILVLRDEEVLLTLTDLVRARFLVFLHTADFKESTPDSDGIFRPMMGNPRLGELVCEYVLVYTDGSTCRLPIRRRFEISEFQHNSGESSFACVPHRKPTSFHTNSEELNRGRVPGRLWGFSQYRTSAPSGEPMRHWLYAAENPHPEKALSAIRFLPEEGTTFIFALSACNLTLNPLRWNMRTKLHLDLPPEMRPDLGEEEDWLNIDLGQIISIRPSLDYDHEQWTESKENVRPQITEGGFIVEYTAHPDALLYLGKQGASCVKLADLGSRSETAGGASLTGIPSAERKVRLRVLDKYTGRPVPARIHVHGQAGEYLPPMNRHRIPNPFWFEDYGTDYVQGEHYCTYIDGEAEFKLPFGQVFVEVTKGFEITPKRVVFTVDAQTDALTVELERVLPWRQKGWVTADTHVHFLSPQTAFLEGEAEGVNVVNLLASQWGEFFSNIGDFDGRTTVGERKEGDGEYLVRVGTENRQAVLGHISLLGYEGRMILPVTTGGPDESALGDPVEATMSTWAAQCRAQNGLAILPHFPMPRAEGAAAIVLERIDAVEPFRCPHGGISPYSLSDWYRYLNCGYHVAAVGGTDKMSAGTAVGTIRTYTLIKDAPFSYDSWKNAVRRGLTFVSCGPLIDFCVDGREPGARIDLPGAGTVDIVWQVASVTIPVTEVELVVNGEIREVRAVDTANGSYAGHWALKLDTSGWIALRVRGGYPGKPKIIAAHTSAIMVTVAGKSCFNAPDAMTILTQIEGATAYVQTIGTKAETAVYEQLIATLTAAHRALHNRLHRLGRYHQHSVVDDHHNS